MAHGICRFHSHLRHKETQRTAVRATQKRAVSEQHRHRNVFVKDYLLPHVASHWYTLSYSSLQMRSYLGRNYLMPPILANDRLWRITKRSQMLWGAIDEIPLIIPSERDSANEVLTGASKDKQRERNPDPQLWLTAHATSTTLLKATIIRLALEVVERYYWLTTHLCWKCSITSSKAEKNIGLFSRDAYDFMIHELGVSQNRDLQALKSVTTMYSPRLMRFSLLEECKSSHLWFRQMGFDWYWTEIDIFNDSLKRL